MSSTAAPDHVGFRSYLKNEFVDRRRSNSSYSLRAFARSLKVSPAALSQMLSGKRPITTKSKTQIAAMLRLSPQEILKIDGLEEVTRPQLGHGQVYDQVSHDVFSVISDWYHLAILSMLSLENFREDPKWIARTLSISPTEVTVAIDRLLRLKMLKRDESGKLVDGTSGFTSSLSKGMTSAAAQKYQQQVFKKAADAVTTVPHAMRDHTGMTFGIRTKDLAIARKKIAALRRELDALFQQSKGHDEVYQLSVALFPLTRNYALAAKGGSS